MNLYNNKNHLFSVKIFFDILLIFLIEQEKEELLIIPKSNGTNKTLREAIIKVLLQSFS